MIIPLFIPCLSLSGIDDTELLRPSIILVATAEFTVSYCAAFTADSAFTLP